MISSIEKGEFCLDPAHDPVVREQLKIILKAVLESSLSPKAVILGGSYGRQEGVINDENLPVNDYDIILVVPVFIPILGPTSLRALQLQLQKTLHIKHMDIMAISQNNFSKSPVSMLRYDLKKNCVVLWGDLNICDLIPEDSPGPFSASEIENLLINRMITLLEAHPILITGRNASEQARQLSKVIFALIDSVLFEENKYCTKYQDKIRAFNELTINSSLVKDLRPISATALKVFLRSGKDDFFESNVWHSMRRHLVQEIQKYLGQSDRNWRGSSNAAKTVRKFAAKVRGRPEKWDVEQRILELLQEEHEDAEWLGKADKLIKEWYA